MKRSPIKQKRDTPRRNEGRVEHHRMKPKAGAPPTAVERRHLERVASMPCLACHRRPVTVHHVTATIHGGRISRSHKRTVPLCPAHHQIQHGSYSVEALSHSGFWLHWGIDLLREADALWLASEAAEWANQRPGLY